MKLNNVTAGAINSTDKISVNATKLDLRLPPKTWYGVGAGESTKKETQLDRIESKLDLVIRLLGEK